MAKRVLIVDDEVGLRELLQIVVEEAGYEAITATNGAEALELMAQARPDLVISDVMMPIINGYVLLENIRLKTEWRAIKVVLVSAAHINKTDEKAQADAYLAKPFNLASVESLIKRLIA